MRVAKVTFVVGLALFGGAAAGLAGTWALVVSTVAMSAAGLAVVIVMEERDYAGIEGLYPTASEPVEDTVAEPAPDPSVAHAA